MSNLYANAVVAGICFCFWPMLMNRSGLSPLVSMTVFCLGCCVVMGVLIAPNGLPSMAGANWGYAASAVAIGAVGMVLFGKIIGTARPEAMASIFLVTVLTQVVAGAVYQSILAGGVPIDKAVGFVAALIACYLLS